MLFGTLKISVYIVGSSFLFLSAIVTNMLANTWNVLNVVEIITTYVNVLKIRNIRNIQNKLILFKKLVKSLTWRIWNNTIKSFTKAIMSLLTVALYLLRIWRRISSNRNHKNTFENSSDFSTIVSLLLFPFLTNGTYRRRLITGLVIASTRRKLTQGEKDLGGFMAIRP